MYRRLSWPLPSMEQRMKQRLVGAIVLVVVVVGVVPELLDSEPAFEVVDVDEVVDPGATLSDEFTSRIVAIDEDASAQQPEDSSASPHDTPSSEEQAEVVTVDLTIQDGMVSAQGSHNVSPAVSAAIPVPRVKPTVNSKGAQVGVSSWVVQLASFSESTRAVALRDKLAGQGYVVFIQSAGGDEGTFSRVLVGPELDKARATALQQALLEHTGLKGRVVRYP